MKKTRNWSLLMLLALFLAAAAIWYGVYYESPRSSLEVDMLDIGQGDAIYIDSPVGIQVIVDGGPGRVLLSALGKVMPIYDRSIDLLMITNPDKDHMSGFIDVLKTYSVGALMIPGTQTSTETYAMILSVAKEKGVPVILARRGEVLDLGGGAYMSILFPDRNVSGLATNTGSIVAKLVFGDSSMLFTGDAPSEVEEFLVLADGKNLKSDVLKVAHHGSKTSVSLPFYNAVNPEYAAISVGAHNMYGHPNKETVDALNTVGITILRTDELGTIKLVSKGDKFVYEK